MPHHFQKNVTETWHFCNTCGRQTKHSVSDGRLGRCMEHNAPLYSKSQLKRREQQEKERREPRLF